MPARWGSTWRQSGFLFFIVRVVDVPLDPIIGHFVDRTNTRLGRFRPWLIAGATLMVAGPLPRLHGAARDYTVTGVSGPAC